MRVRVRVRVRVEVRVRVKVRVRTLIYFAPFALYPKVGLGLG